MKSQYVITVAKNAEERTKILSRHKIFQRHPSTVAELKELVARSEVEVKRLPAGAAIGAYDLPTEGLGRADKRKGGHK